MLGLMVSKFDRQNLIDELNAIIGPCNLDTTDLRTGFCVIAKRLDVGSNWIIANNPKSQFWDTPSDRSFIGNRHYPLINLIRARGAPSYFDPELIEIVPNQAPGMFIDGGLTPHNNPALQLLLYAALPQYGLSWPLGTDNLTIVSIGTGSSRPRVGLEELAWIRPVGVAIRALTAQISESEQLVQTLMSWLGETSISWRINSELTDTSKIPAPYNRPMFRFLRYNIRLEQEWLARELGVHIDKKTISRYEMMDVPENIPAIYELAVRAAERQIKREHFQ